MRMMKDWQNAVCVDLYLKQAFNEVWHMAEFEVLYLKQVFDEFWQMA